jgi:hypothetical protein
MYPAHPTGEQRTIVMTVSGKEEGTVRMISAEYFGH